MLLVPMKIASILTKQMLEILFPMALTLRKAAGSISTSAGLAALSSVKEKVQRFMIFDLMKTK